MNRVMLRLVKEHFKHKEVIDRTGQVPPLTPEEEAAAEKRGEDMMNEEAKPIIKRVERGELTPEEGKRALIHNLLRWRSEVLREKEIIYEIEETCKESSS
jgi:hypothetical protein